MVSPGSPYSLDEMVKYLKSMVKEGDKTLGEIQIYLSGTKVVLAEDK